MRLFSFLKKKKTNKGSEDSITNKVSHLKNDSFRLEEDIVSTDNVKENVLNPDLQKEPNHSNNKYDLSIYIEAQNNSYIIAFSEISNGVKYGHWMWYIFPQLKGLGKSPNSNYYGIENYEEALEYLKHLILGKRLLDIIEALLKLENVNLVEVLGRTDYKKLKSCMTLFYEVSNYINNEDNLFGEVLDKYYDSKCDMNTLRMLEAQNFVSYNC